MAKKLAIRTEKAPAPLQGAPYSQAVRVDNLVFVSGQIALKPGETSQPVETLFGLHLIQVEEKKAAENRELNQVEEEIARRLYNQQQAKHLIQQAEDLLDRVNAVA